jgi:hypothetical protein
MARDTFYIVNPAAPTFSVWMRKPIKAGKKGYFTRDFNGGYPIRNFAYASMKGAQMIVDRIMRNNPEIKEMAIFNREGLFNHLDIDDWSHGH